MSKSLRRKFILAAMLSLLILIAIIIGGMALLGYYRMEQSADSMLQMLASGPKPSEPGGRPPFPAFGYHINPTPRPAGYFVAFVSDDGQILSIDPMGMMEITEEDAEQYVRHALLKEATDGKIGSYKYKITQEAKKTLRIIFLDISAQVQTLMNTVVASIFVGLFCMALMFVILFFVSGHVIGPLARNIEKQRQFVSNAGHEIKTPLGIIMANTDALELHTGESKWSRNIRSQAERMHGLMNQLLLLARTDEGPAAVPFEAVRLSNLVKDMHATFQQPAKNKQIRLHAEIKDNIIVQGNSDNLEQLVSILFDNAVKYANVGGDIAVHLISEGRKSRLIVENSIDALPDVPPDTLFDRFYRANAARTQKDGGYGIGLSAARAIAKMHGGKIEASYIAAHRIRFTVELP